LTYLLTALNVATSEDTHMKILKRAPLVLVILIGAYLIIGLFTPSNVHVERSTYIESDAVTVFGEINSLRQWKKWSYWDNIDSNMTSTYEGLEAGFGAKHIWESSNDRVENGSLTITSSETNYFIETELAFEDMGTSLGGWKIRDTTGGVIVNTYMDMNVPFYAAPMMFFFNFDEILEKEFQKSLEGLKRHIANLPSPDTTEVAIIETTLGPLEIMTVALLSDSVAGENQQNGYLVEKRDKRHDIWISYTETLALL